LKNWEETRGQGAREKVIEKEKTHKMGLGGGVEQLPAVMGSGKLSKGVALAFLDGFRSTKREVLKRKTHNGARHLARASRPGESQKTLGSEGLKYEVVGEVTHQPDKPHATVRKKYKKKNWGDFPK